MESICATVLSSSTKWSAASDGRNLQSGLVSQITALVYTLFPELK